MTVEEYKTFSRVEIEQLIDLGEPVSFNMGSSETLAQFELNGAELIVQLYVVERGGDGTLVKLLSAIESVSRNHEIRRIKWQVFAVNCSKPNPKLQRVLTGFGFELTKIDGKDSHFEKSTSINDTVLRRR